MLDKTIQNQEANESSNFYENEMLTTKEIIERGWTKGWISKLLGDPDEIKELHNFGIGDYTLFLYDLKRIENIERTEQFSLLKLKQTKRKETSQKAKETKEENLRKYINSLKIKIPLLRKDDLIDYACSSYNDMQNFYENFNYFADSKSNKEFLNRISVNYLRHCESNYENIIENIFGKTGKNKALLKLRRKIYQKIAFIYPHLKSECINQFFRRYEENLYVSYEDLNIKYI